MKPFARLYISRQRLYEKTCENAEEEEGEVNACKTTKWGEFSECNVKCGKGKIHRQRSYVNPSLAHSMNCKKKLTERKPCEGTDTNCDENGLSSLKFRNKEINLKNVFSRTSIRGRSR